MPNENYNETIDQKLSELYDLLNDLNTLKDKTEAVQQIVDGLSAAGRERVAEIESATGRLGDGVKKSIEIVRKAFASSTNAAKETMEKGVADTRATLDESVAKVAKAVDDAGKVRINSMKTTAAAFSQAVSGLVQSANEGTARMAEIVAELRGLPMVEELHAVKKYSEKLTEEIKKVTEAIAKINGALAEARTSVECRMDALEKGVMAAIKETAQSMAVKLDALSADMATQADDIKEQINVAEKALCTVIAEKAASLTEENERLSAKLSEIGASIESLTEEMKMESKINQHKISIGIWIIGVLLGLLTLLSLPAIISGWKALFG